MCYFENYLIYGKTARYIQLYELNILELYIVLRYIKSYPEVPLLKLTRDCIPYYSFGKLLKFIEKETSEKSIVQFCSIFKNVKDKRNHFIHYFFVQNNFYTVEGLKLLNVELLELNNYFFNALRNSITVLDIYKLKMIKLGYENTTEIIESIILKLLPNKNIVRFHKDIDLENIQM